MAESTKAIASLKKAANYTKLALHKDGPRSFKRGQGALIKVIYKFGDGSLGKDAAKKTLGWRGCDVRSVAKKAADNGYLTITDPEEGFQMTLTPLGTEVVKKRLVAEDKAADKVLSGLSDAEKDQLIALCDKISATAEEMGVEYSRIQKKRGRHHGQRCCKNGAQGREGKKGRTGKKDCGDRDRCDHHDHHSAPQYVFIFKSSGDCCHHEEC